MTETLNQPAPIPASGGPSIFNRSQVTRLLLLIATVVCWQIFSFGAKLIGWPSEKGYRGSLAQPPAAMGALLCGIVLLVVCIALASILLRRRWPLMGLMVATFGLTAWAARGGGCTAVFLAANSQGTNNGVFFQMLWELVIWFVPIGLAWNLLWMRDRKTLEPDGDDGAVSIGATLSAVAAQAALIAILALILIATQQKKQVLAGLFLSGCWGTALARMFFPGREAGRWYWVGPLAAGILGYIANYFSGVGLEIGQLTGPFAPLGRALPLDYASAGCAGTLLGHWWLSPEEKDESVPAPTPQATPGVQEPALPLAGGAVDPVEGTPRPT